MEGGIKLLLKNYFEGQIHDSDDNPAVPPTFKKKENTEYQQIFEKFIKEQKKIFRSWRESDKEKENAGQGVFKKIIITIILIFSHLFL